MIQIDTDGQTQIVDITPRIQKVLQESSVESGLCLVFTMHTTAAIIVNEADPALQKDMLGLLQRLVPAGAGYFHDRSDGNAHAHLQASILGNCVVIPVEQNQLVLGTWQRVLFFELDGPRHRSVFVRALPD